MHTRLAPRPLRELATYVAASGMAFLVDLGLLALLVTRFGWSTLVAASASFVAGALVLYVLSISFVFDHRRYRDVRIEAPYFVAIGLVGLTINAAVIYLVLETLNAHFVVAKFAAAGCTFAVSYLLRRTLLFRPSPAPQTGTSQ